MLNKKPIILFILGLSYAYLNAEVLVFSKAYELATTNANAYKSAQYQAEASKEKVNQEYSRLYPQLNFSAYYKKSDYEYNKNYNASGNHVKQGLINYSLSLKQSIYNADTYSRISMETSRSKLSQIAADMKKEELAQNVFKVYLNILKSYSKIRLSKSYLEFEKSKLDGLTKKYEMHLANKMDLLQMRVEYNSAQIDLKKEKKLLKVNELKLKQFIGEVSYIIPILVSDKSILDTIDLLKKSIANNKDFSKNLNILQAKIGLKLSKETIENSFDAHKPTLDLQASVSKYETDDPTADSYYNTVQQAMVMLNIPIYSGGMTSSRVTTAELMSKAANEDLLNAKKDAKIQYDEYTATFEATVESVSMYKDALDSAELYVEAIEQGYEHGLKSVIDLNDAKNKLYEVRYKYIENIYEMVDSYIGLLIVTNDFESVVLLDKLVY